MPQVKIKQGTKSSINNNAGVLNAGTLAITTDTNELFVTHNDGTMHQLCNPIINVASPTVIDKSYSAKWSDDHYMPIAFSTRYYFIKNTLTTAILDGKPTLNANNYLQLTTTNQTIDWNSTNKLVLTRTSANDITFNQDSIFNHKIYCSFDRNCEITFGFRRFANGIQVSSNDTKVVNFANGVVTAVDIQLVSNLLVGNTLYPAGTVFTDEIFISQDTPSTIISKYYCGVNIGGVDYYSWHSLSTPATSLNTDQIADLAITKPKLSQDTYDWIDWKVDKAGDTMSGDLDMGGNELKNVAIEVVTSLPTTNNFVGRQVTYQGRSYIWDGSAWKNDSDYLEIGGRNLLFGTNTDNWSIYSEGLKTISLEKTSYLIKVANNGTFTNIGIYLSYSPKTTLLREGVNYILSFYIRGTKAPNYNYIMNTGVSNSPLVGSLEKAEGINTSNFIKVEKRFVGSSLMELSTGSYLLLRLTNSLADDWFEIKDVKLEKGNKATDWTPAPEDKANENQTINFDTNNIEPTQTGTTTKTSTWIWQYLTQSINFLWLKLKDLFPSTQATTHNYLPKIDNSLKKLVKSNIQDDGSRVQIDSPLRLNNSIFYNVAQYGYNGGITGVIKILLPSTITSNGHMLQIEIDIYNYINNNTAKIIISGYPQFIGTIWQNYSATILGRIPTSSIRLAYDGQKHCILIGTTSTQWAYPQIFISRVFNRILQTTDLSLGWEISIITDETGITNIVTPQVNAGFDVDLLDGKHASDFATSTHNHDGIYSTTDTKNTAGATNTSSKIYLVGSTEQTTNPQTYTHDTAYVDVDGNLYSNNSKTITNSDLETNQIVTPTLNPTWTVRNYAGTVISSPTNPSGGAISGTNIVLEYGFKPSMTVKGKWITQVGYDDPISCSGLCGTSLPASNIETVSTASIDLYNSTTYSSTTVPITTSDYWTIFTPKKGITVSGSSLILPTGNISASARTQVTYQLPVYYGNVTTLTITEAIIEALSTKTWKNYQTSSKTISLTINSSDSEYWIYAYPAAWGNLSTISNADGDWMAAFTSGTVSITGAPGLAILYNYYITVNRGAFKSKTINFS